ncbi:MAG: alpha/beta fold hydrolase [Acidimicrobiales bacterium]
MLHHTAQGPSGPLSGNQGPSGPLSGNQGPSGPLGGTRIVLVHGFTQTGRSWDHVAEPLRDRGFEVVRVDLPGHGGSSDVRLCFTDTALAIGEVGGTGCYVGYSMGGRLCLRLAIERPDLVRSLVLVGASPGLADPAERAERRQSDARLATDIEGDGTVGFLERWLAQPLFETTTPRDEDLAARRANPPRGLAYALRELGTGNQEPLWDRLGELGKLGIPTLLIVGEADAKFRAIAQRMADAMSPPPRVEVVAGAGHAVPLDQPEACTRLIAEAARHAVIR